MKVFTAADLAEDYLKDATVAVLGYGNQGHAHALNLRDSGTRVVVGAREDGASALRARGDRFDVMDIVAATAAADVIAILLPDEIQTESFANEIAPALRKGATLVFAHGFAVAFDGIKIPDGHDVVLVAPKAQGHFVRSEFLDGRGVPCMLAVAADASGNAQQKALSYASRIGCLRSGAIATTFREEAITDLFGEQAVLCGGVPELIKAAFDTLVARGYAPEVAYIECLQELKIIADLMYDGGLHYMRTHISRTAAWGSFTGGERLVTDETRRTLASMLDDIESGKFAREWLNEARAGQKNLDARIQDESAHKIESAGREARSLMNSPTERKKT
ncbi:MAG TPA: ketol-acid reductoisomerase [Candidatus Krumholzibacteria bacterium]|nr:ketol-acid reductoisomerase [Candidatus Krumholzibacteria bacterium]